MSNSFRNDENEFLNGNFEQYQMKGSRSASTDEIINKMEEKNYVLKKQVNKIERVLSTMKVEEKPRYGIVLPQIKPDIIKKQLQNAYKQIKIYQHQVEKKRNSLNSEGAYVQQINKVEKYFKQKIQIHDRLKRQMLILKNQAKEITKNLKNNHKKMEYEALQNKLSTDIKYIQQKLRDYQQRRTSQISLLQRQRASIKEMQVQILKQNSNQYIQGIKFKIFKPSNSQHNAEMSPSRSIFDIQNDASKQQSRVSKAQGQTQQVEDKTPEAYASLMNDIRLLKKMQTDYEAKINLISKERDEQSQKNFRARNKILEVQYQIESMQKSIAQVKKLIDPNIFKPKLLKSDDKKKQAPKKKALSIIHSYKNVQLGQLTKNGKRFSDRSIIGKINSKIVGVTLYQRQQSNQFVGIQATYKTQDGSIRKGNVNTRADLKKQAIKEETLKLQGDDYIKTVDLFIKKSKIIGISIVSYKNKMIKIGDILQAQRLPLQMSMSQYPMCFYGSTLVDGFQCFGVEVYEQNPGKKHQNGD